MRTTNDPDATVGDLERLINIDQSFAARVLKIANSSLYGSRTIGTISHATRLLGSRELRNIASSMAVAPQFRTPPQSLLDGPQLWKHALACGLWTQRIAKYLNFIQTENLYTVGLLHDIGLIVLAKVAGLSFDQVLRLNKDHNENLIESEERILQTNHTRVGAMVCAKWMLPPQIVQIILSHHHIRVPSGPAVRILALAEHLASRFNLSEFLWCKPQDHVQRSLLEDLDISEVDVEKLATLGPEIAACVEQLSQE